MTRFLRRLLCRHDVVNALACAKYYHRLGMACARRGQGDSAQECRKIRDVRLWEARQLSR